ncbi:hypothetical protein SNEBB_006719 [Seison nebaliae]|nr:hypothetical protein SNEBB_006719 [Seison nebaliae]
MRFVFGIISRQLRVNSLRNYGNNPIHALCVGKRMDLDELKERYENDSVYHIQSLPIDVVDCVSLIPKYDSPSHTSHNIDKRQIFVFNSGCIVLWNITSPERYTLITDISKFCRGTYSSGLVAQEIEHSKLSYWTTSKNDGNEECYLSDDTLHFQMDRMNSNRYHLYKYAFSHSMASSVKLGIWERQLEKEINSLDKLAVSWRQGTEHGVDRRNTSRSLGRLFHLKNAINLRSELLDIPDFIWDREYLEDVYLQFSRHYRLRRRTYVVNSKLDHSIELLNMLHQQLNDAHHVKLERMIIFLIAIEILIPFIMLHK